MYRRKNDQKQNNSNIYFMNTNKIFGYIHSPFPIQNLNTKIQEKPLIIRENHLGRGLPHNIHRPDNFRRIH